MRKLFITLAVGVLAALSASAQVGLVTGGVFPGGGGSGVSPATFASPPPFPVVNQVYLFTDASASGVCTGGGSAYALCAWNGASFIAAGGSSTGLGDPGSNSVVFRNGSGTSIPATATQMSGPNFCADAGSTDAYACNLSPVIASYVTGTMYWFKANTVNTGAASINFNAKGALPLKKMLGSISLDVVTGDILVGQWVGCIYDGTNCQTFTNLGTTVDTTSTQTLTGKTVDGVSPTTMGFVDPTSSIQTQLNGKQASLGFTAENTANKDANSGYAGLTAGGLLKAAELPTTVELNTNKDAASGYAGLDASTHIKLAELNAGTNNCIVYRDNSGALNCLTAASIGAANAVGVSAGQFTGLAISGGGGGGGGGINAYTITTTASSADDKHLATMNGSSITYTLAATPPSATWSTLVMNLNATDLTINRNTTTINGQNANIVLHQGQRTSIYTDNSNYFASIPDQLGAGLSLSCTLTGCTWSVNTAVIPSIATFLQGDNTTVFSTTGTTAYVGSPVAGCATATLKSGAMVDLIPDTASTTSASFNFCGLGFKSIKKSDGVTDPGTTITASITTRLQYDGTVWRQPAASAGGGTPCTSTALSLQYNNASAFGCLAEFTYASSTITASSSGKVDLSATSPTAGLKLPSAAGAVPTADGFLAVNTTNHTLVYGVNGTTGVSALAATGTNTATTCTNQAVTAVSGIAVPTCSTITPSFATGNTSGSGNFVLVTSPTLVTPALGAATGTSLALGGASIGSNALAITGTMSISGLISGGTIRQYGASFGTPGGVALTAGMVQYFDMPQGCIIIGGIYEADAGTFTVKFWKVADGTAIPTVANVINTAGVGLATGTRLKSFTTSDFTTTTVSAYDAGAVTITAVSGAGYVNAKMLCQ